MSKFTVVGRDNPPPSLANGGGGPHYPGVEARLAKIEAIVPTLATRADIETVRADLHKMDASIVRWMIGTIIALFIGFAGLFFTMSNSINGALERASQSTAPVPQPPIVINVPAPAAPTPAQEPSAN